MAAESAARAMIPSNASTSRTRWPFPKPPIAGLHDIAPIWSRLKLTRAMRAPIRAAADGIVSVAELTHAYGNMVKIDHGAGLETRYAHASKLLVKVGERVVKGQVVAEVGSTGRSTGPHLHYEIRLNGNSLDPRQYLQKSAI